VGSSPPHRGPALRRRIRDLTPEAAVVSSALRRRQTGSGDTMDPTRHSGIVDGLEAMKAAGLIIRYNLTWERPGGEPKVAVWRACDTPDDELRKSIAGGLAGLVTEAQLSIVPSAEHRP